MFLKKLYQPDLVIRLSFSFLFLLFSFQDGNIPLFAAVEAGNLHVCRELLLQETEAQLKYTKPPLKDTALHLAARKRDNDLVKLFIEAGAVVDSQNVRKQCCYKKGV